MIKFNEFLRHADDNIVNSFLVFYLQYYFEVDITKEQGIFRKEFSYNEVEHVIGELKKRNNYSFDSKLFDKINELIINFKYIEEFYGFMFSTIDYSQEENDSSPCKFKIIKNSTSSKKVITDKMRRDKPETTNLEAPIILGIYVYTEKNIYIEDYYNKLVNECTNIFGYNASLDDYEHNLCLIKSNLIIDGKLPDITEELCKSYLELLDT